MPLCFPKYDQIPIKIEDIRSKQKPINSAPIFIATVNEYKIAVVTPVHSKILLFIIESYLNILGFCRMKLLLNYYESPNKQKISVCFLVEFNYYGYKHSLTERWLSG